MMADDESESDAASKDESFSLALSIEKDNDQVKLSQSAAALAASGPRKISIERSEYGFGFTLRHFIVYPPESGAILARNGRLGAGCEAMANEPIDTIFVKNVRPNGPADTAGLRTGDRIITVNGQDIAGLSYLRVVHLIFETKGCLHLLVVPQENDALQLYFGLAAHHPETNQKPRYYPEVAAQSDSNMASINRRYYSRCDTTPTFSDSNSGSRVTSPGNSGFTDGKTTNQLYLKGSHDSPLSNDSSYYGCENSRIQYGPNLGRSFSLDVEFDRNNYDSMSDSSGKDYLGSDDSLMMNRLRKSLEQRQEFMNRLPHPVSEIREGVTISQQAGHFPKPKSTVEGYPRRSLEVDNGQNSSQTNTNFYPSSPFQIVSLRKKQFETGPIDLKTELFRSELARLNVKRNVAYVAARKRDFENLAEEEKSSGYDVKENRIMENKEVPVYCSSGNRTIPIGSSKLHCEPPVEFLNSYMRNKDTRNTDLQEGKPVVRQDSYLAACRKPTITITRNDVLHEKLRRGEVSPVETDDDKATRRISYLKATAANSMNVDSENEFSDAEPTPVTPQRRSTRKWRTPSFPGDIQRLRRFFEELAASGGERGILGSRKTNETIPDQEQCTIIKEGNLFCKVIQVEGKKASDRSWKPIGLILKGCVLSLYKEKKESLFSETPATFDKSDLGASCDRLDIRCSVVDVANDYTKRKHVFRLNAPSVGTEILFQAHDANSMSQWVKVLQEQSLVPINANEPLSTNFAANSSPSACNKTLRKLASLRNRSPTGEVLASSKAKKLAQNDLQQISPKTKTWKNKMAKQLRKIQAGSSSPVSAAAVTYPPGATIGIPLEFCPSSTFSEYVPLLVEVCANIVEAKGLEIIGVYRVPGNTAAVTSLTEEINRGLDITTLDRDPRWSDVNVVSSLLKSFFRKLPDPLLTSELYPNFMKSDDIEDPVLRMITIRKLVHDLPDHNLETLKYLLFHLKKVIANSSINKMEARNLAIVFGPTLIRSDNDMFTMVTDMSHQFKIVESLLSHVDWCFGDGNMNDLKAIIQQMSTTPGEQEPPSSSHNLLLRNIHKVEGCMQSPSVAKDFMSTILGAANRKMMKSKHSSNRKSNNLITSHTVSSGSEDTLDSLPSATRTSIISRNLEKNSEKKDSEKSVEQKVEVKVTNENTNSVTIDNIDDTSNKEKAGKDRHDDVVWSYPKMEEETKQRIRKFEEETEALLQRCTIPNRRSSYSVGDQVKDGNNFVRSKEPAFKLNEQPIFESPPPIAVTRKNLPQLNVQNVTASNIDKSNVSEECNQNNSVEKSMSLDSLNRSDRPLSRLSDDGCDLLMTLTSTFDKKLKSLSNDKSLAIDECDATKPIVVDNPVGIQKNPSFRDPSLHRTLKKSALNETTQTFETNSTKENGKKMEPEKDTDEAEMKSCTACGCSVKHSEAIQQNCDNWRRTVLQEMQLLNRLQNVPREIKLFHSNSVKLRKSESFKEDNAAVKLRRSGSLNKHEPKISKFESLMLMKNAEAIKLKRSDSLTKNEKTETNMKRRQMDVARKSRNDKEGKLKRRNGTGRNRNIKRRHTVGGTKDFDKVSWLENQRHEDKENRKERRTSSPDLSSTRVADFLVEVVVRPRSFITADPNLVSRLLNIPLESHV